MARDAYLKLDGLKGDALAKGFEGWIEIDSFSWGAQNAPIMGMGAGGKSSGRVNVSEFSVIKRVDSTTPILFQYCCLGKHFASASVALTKAGGTGQDVKYLTYDLKEVFVSSLAMSGSGSDKEIPMDSLSFSFGQVEISYTPQDAKGGPGSPVRASYDVQLHK
jgi:type VI secretion system secreted protein Hcp